MAAIAIDHYNLRADREMMAVLHDFYCEFVGLRPGPRAALQSFGYWLYAGDHAVLHLSETRSGEIRQTVNTSTFDHVAFQCHDLAGMCAKLDRADIPYRLSVIPASSGFAEQRQVFFQDPAGNGIELNFR